MDQRVDRLRVGVLGLTSGGGSGFLAVCLARALAEQGNMRPVVLELGNGGLYDRLGMDKRFPGDRYFSFHEAVIADRSIRGRSNMTAGVNWMLKDVDGDLDIFRRLRLLHNSEGDIIFSRMSGLNREDLWRLLPEMDRILVAVDPLPSAMLEGYELLCQLRTSGHAITYVVNKMNGGVNRRELLAFLNVGKPCYVPMIPQEAVYGAEYACSTVYDMPQARKLLMPACDEILDKLLRPGALERPL